MSYLLDTNAVSEPGRKAPDPVFMQWWSTIESGQVFLSALTLGEIRHGVVRLPQGPQRQRLERFSAMLRLRFSDQVLMIDERVADTWGELSAQLKEAGRPVGAIDALIAATALTHDLTVVTRNASHFIPTGCKLLVPWTAADNV